MDTKCFQLGKLLILQCLVVKLKIGTYFWHLARTKDHYLLYQTSIPSAQQSQPSINYNSSIQLNITDFAHSYTDKIHINNHNYTYSSHKLRQYNLSKKLRQYICDEKILKNVTKKGIKLRVWESDVGQIGEFVYVWLGWVKIKEDLWK